MGLLGSLFASPRPSPQVAREMDLGRYFYLMDYAAVYADFLDGLSNRASAIAELYLFRAWITQCGFRIFSSSPEVSERITYEVVNLSNTLGRVVLATKANVHFDRLFSTDYMSVLDDRWQEYDSILIERRSDDEPFAPFPVCFAVSEHCGGKDPIRATLLAQQYLMQLLDIKQEALTRRILS